MSQGQKKRLRKTAMRFGILKLLTMTREEQTREASKSIFTFNLPDGLNSGFIETLQNLLQEAFVKGAEWADSHPETEFFKIPDAEDLNIET